MGIIRKLTDLQLGSIQTSKILTIDSAEVIYQVESANRAIEITNHGSHNLYYGDSALTINTGGFIVPNGAKFWDTITDDFQLYLRVLSGGVTDIVTVHEYAGN